MDLFEEVKSETIPRNAPLALRMRPRSLDEYVGQGHVLGKGQLLRRALAVDRLTSLILYGPPGVGKTALAHVIAAESGAQFVAVNAVSSNVRELRQLIADASRHRRQGHRTILFVDEIHRFNKAQQDVLLPEVEAGTVTLVGATTLNPCFALTAPLVSRSLVIELKALTSAEIAQILQRAVEDEERGLGAMALTATPEAIDRLADLSDGDARRALNALEVAALTVVSAEEEQQLVLTPALMEECIQRKTVVYDRDGDAHYDAASAFIKSMRGSDPDAAIYWMAKMLYAGEDPRFIARRLMICAAEDVGNADPQALVVAGAAVQAVEVIGLPECKIPLAQAVTYVATAPKSNAAYAAIQAAEHDVASGRALEVPNHLKDASYSGAKQLGHGQGYQYVHDFADHHVAQEYLPAPRQYYMPTDQGHERVIAERLQRWRAAATADDTVHSQQEGSEQA